MRFLSKLGHATALRLKSTNSLDMKIHTSIMSDDLFMCCCHATANAEPYLVDQQKAKLQWLIWVFRVFKIFFRLLAQNAHNSKKLCHVYVGKSS